ncbi:unnamed protein product [Schistosoma margrebowiei]|uniref:Uncharacterized protein n=1 Tax=Schistosoma margrebowiei TaxID=48269 RepID=A0A183LBW2_9TREM|nr:unnamed protein product [Schistosoma margrebowiei]
MNIIQCYASTNDSNDDIKDQFYERLQSIIEKCPRKDLTILMGDLNAKVGQWKMLEVRGGAQITSDHHLVVAKMKLRLKKNWKTGQTAIQRFNTAFLRDTDRLNEFKIALNNRFQALQDLLKDEETTMKNNWKETLDKIKERKNKKTSINNSRTRAEEVQAQAEYTEADKQVKRSIRDDKKKYVEELATTSEKAAIEGNMKHLYDTTKKLAGKYSKPKRPVKDKEGRPITKIQGQRSRWVEYFEELLNRPALMNSSDIKATYTDLPIDVTPQTTEEIRMVIKQIKSGKAAKPDNISGEALKPNCDTTDHRRIIS